MKNSSIRTPNLLFFRQNIEGVTDSSRKQWTTCTPCMDRWKQVAFWIVLIRVLFGDERNLRLNQERHLIRNRHFVAEHLGFLNIPVEKPSSLSLLQARIMAEVQHIGDPPT